MSKLMVSMPERMIKNIAVWAQMESCSKSELLRQALRFWREQKRNKSFTLEEIDKGELVMKTEKLAQKIAAETSQWNSTSAIRRMRTKR